MLASALQTLFTPEVFIALIVGVVGGMIIGAMPGLSASMAVALLIPVTYGMSAAAGLTMLTAVYTSAIYGGSITACLLHTPGTPSSAATAMDGYALTKQGRGLKAIGTSTICSMIGGTVSALCLLFIAPPLSKVVLSFSSLEYFLLAVFGLTIIGSVAGDNMIKGLLSGCFGVLVGTIGIDIFNGTPRYTFGSINMESGIQLVPAMIGLFSLSQVMVSIEDIVKGNNRILDKSATHLSGEMMLTRKEMKTLAPTIAQSSIIGVLVGILPGAGGDIGSWISYNTAKKTSKHPEEFGHGSLEGIAASEAANNAVTGGALIPMLTLGIPGESVTAVLMGGLIIQGLQPGPELFTRYAPMTYTFFAGFVLVQFFMLGIGLLGCRGFAQISRLSDAILIPSVAVLCVVGSFAIHKNFFDVVIMMIFGVLGYLVRKFDLNPAAIVLALILGPIGENGLRRSLRLSGGSPAILFSTPLCWVLIALCVFGVCSPIFMNRMEKKAVENAGGDIPNETGDDPVRTSD